MNKREAVAEFIEKDSRYLDAWADKAIIGYDEFGRIVYDGESMIQIVMSETGCGRYEAVVSIDNELKWLRQDGFDPIIFWKL